MGNRKETKAAEKGAAPIKAFPRPSYEELEAELHALKVEHANRWANVERIAAWLDDPSRKRAVNAFTEGTERQIAYRFERLLQGEFICGRCGLRKDAEGQTQPDF